jgi:hypothetical protein
VLSSLFNIKINLFRKTNKKGGGIFLSNGFVAGDYNQAAELPSPVSMATGLESDIPGAQTFQTQQKKYTGMPRIVHMMV